MTDPFGDPFGDDAGLAEFEAEQRREYSKYVAADVIRLANGALVHNAGDPVPISNVEKWGMVKRGMVRLADAWAEEHPEDVEEFEAQRRGDKPADGDKPAEVSVSAAPVGPVEGDLPPPKSGRTSAKNKGEGGE